MPADEAAIDSAHDAVVSAWLCAFNLYAFIVDRVERSRWHSGGDEALANAKSNQQVTQKIDELHQANARARTALNHLMPEFVAACNAIAGDVTAATGRDGACLHDAVLEWSAAVECAARRMLPLSTEEISKLPFKIKSPRTQITDACWKSAARELAAIDQKDCRHALERERATAVDRVKSRSPADRPTIEHANGEVRKHPVGGLADLLRMTTRTLAGYTEAAGVTTPARGKKNHKFTDAERIAILAHIAEQGATAELRELAARLQENRN